MARIEGSSGTLAEVDTGSLAQRTSIRPMRTLAWNSLAVQTGLLSGIAAGGRIFSFRNTHASNLILVRRAGLGFMTTTAFTAAQALDFACHIARGFTVGDTGGTDITPLVNDTKHRASLATPNVQGRVSATVVVSGGTLTADANSIGRAAGGSTGLGTGLPPAQDNLISEMCGDMPVVLAANEGIIINNVTLMGAAGVVKVYINLEYAEVAPADFA